MRCLKSISEKMRLVLQLTRKAGGSQVVQIGMLITSYLAIIKLKFECINNCMLGAR